MTNDKDIKTQTNDPQDTESLEIPTDLDSRTSNGQRNGAQTETLLKELFRKVETTYRVRIISSERLRTETKEHKKINIFYTILVTILSIITISKNTCIGSIDISSVVLALSVTLSYYMFYVSAKNLDERALKMEKTYQELGVLRNKLSFILNDCNLQTPEMTKKLYKEYEKILSNTENHEPIDYDTYLYNLYLKSPDTPTIDKAQIEKIEKIMKKKNRMNHVKNIFVYVIPCIIFVVILYFIIGPVENTPV